MDSSRSTQTSRLPQKSRPVGKFSKRVVYGVAGRRVIQNSVGAGMTPNRALTT